MWYDMEKGTEFADEVKVAYQQSLKHRDYPVSPRWVQRNHRVLTGLKREDEEVTVMEHEKDFTRTGWH